MFDTRTRRPRFFPSTIVPGAAFAALAFLVALPTAALALTTGLGLHATTKAGSITVGVKPVGVGQVTRITVTLPAGLSAHDKAKAIADTLVLQGIAAYVDADSVKIDTRAGWVISNDTTGEGPADRVMVAQSLPDPWGTSAPNGVEFDLLGTATGISPDSHRPGTVGIGTTRFVSTLSTSPGQSAFQVLQTAQSQLLAHGISCSLLGSGGSAALKFVGLPAADLYMQFGSDDGGLAYTFTMVPQQSLPGAGPISLMILALLLLVAGGVAVATQRRRIA